MVKMERDNKFVDEIFKERKWGHCQKEKGCKMSGTNKNRKRCKLKGTEEVLSFLKVYLALKNL